MKQAEDLELRREREKNSKNSASLRFRIVAAAKIQGAGQGSDHAKNHTDQIDNEKSDKIN